ncbi:MAG TPA: ABATE domain-containing protein [Solirubrobacteraceae bacterium]|jgi:predicted RNA-binding Zn ribbon-like protein|nr:ABATE domain-containing protein [Solirubrobacteraceae bacterium]
MHTGTEPPLVGGNVALDFVNTVDEHRPLVAETLQTVADLRAWGQRCGVLSEGATGDDDPTELGRAVAARELLYSLLRARMSGAEPARAQLDELARLTTEAYATATLTPTGDGGLRWNWDPDDIASVRHVAVTAAMQLLEGEPSTRLKQCSGESCDWLFLDTSKRGNRRWCSMSECGQEAKDEQRRARRHARPAA